MSTLRDSLSVDPPVIQTAAFRFGAIELAAIDDKIRACEEHLVRSLIRGAVAPNYLVRASSPNESLLTKGAAVCCAGTANPLEIDAATDANLVAQSGRIVGLLLADTGLGNYAAVVVAGVVPGALTGLGTGSAGPVYVDGTTARLTRTSTSYQVGTTDAVGNVLLGGASSGGGGSVVFSGDLAGNAFAQSVRGFYGKVLAGAASVLGQLYVYNGTAFELQTATATATANALVKADGSGKIAIGYLPTGQTSTTVPLGNDSRLSDARTPTAHAASHRNGGSDEIATATAAANAIPKAGAGGTLAVNWLPTGTSSATVCIGNDSRLAPTPSESATGCVLVSSGATIKAIGPAGRWWNSAITGLSPSSTAPSTASVTMTGPFLNAAFRVGEPIRVLEKASIVYNASQLPTVYSTAITAVKGSILDYRLSFYAKTVQVSGNTYRFNLYADETCSTQIGYTASFDAGVSGQSSALTITSTVGISGTITAYSSFEARTAGLVHRISQARTGIVTAYDSSTGVLTFAGQAVSTASGNVVEVWRGAPELVVPYDASIPGVFSGATTSTGLKDRTGILRNWDGPNATLCQVVASQGVVDTGATQPKIAPVVASTQLIADGSALALSTADTRVATAVQMTAASMEVKTGDRLELRIVAGANANARDLSATFKMVLD